MFVPGDNGLSQLAVSTRAVTQSVSEKLHSWPADTSAGMRSIPFPAAPYHRDPKRVL